MVSVSDDRDGDESSKRGRSSAKLGFECSTSDDGFLSAPSCLLTLDTRDWIAMVAVGGCHMLALSVAGQVSGWGH